MSGRLEARGRRMIGWLGLLVSEAWLAAGQCPAGWQENTSTKKNIPECKLFFAADSFLAPRCRVGNGSLGWSSCPCSLAGLWLFACSLAAKCSRTQTKLLRVLLVVFRPISSLCAGATFTLRHPQWASLVCSRQSFIPRKTDK